jgi:hypothetical protein
MNEHRRGGSSCGPAKPASGFGLGAIMRVALAFAAVSLAAPSRGSAQAASHAGEYQILGFRSAKFGMSPPEVRAAAMSDFGVSTLQTNANPAEGTQALQLDAPRLDPGPGPAQITYIFGARTHTLAHINVVWLTGPNPTPDERAAILTGAVQLAHYFQTLPTPLKASLGARRTGPNSLSLFAGVDTKGAGVEVAADGVTYEISDPTAGAKTPSPEPKGPALLRVSYVRDVAHPDIIKIAPGAF